MKNLLRNITVLLLSGAALCDVHSIFVVLYPEWMLTERSMWGDRNIDVEGHPEKITVAYYMLELENIIALIIWSFAFAIVANLVSNKLCKIVLIFSAYFATQAFFYIWDRNTVFFSNIIVYLYVLGAILYYRFSPTKEGGKLINIEDY